MADHFQIASWQAAIVGTIVAAVLGVVNLALGLLRQAREDKRKRAEAAALILKDKPPRQG